MILLTSLICAAFSAIFASGTARAKKRARVAERAYSGRFLMAFSCLLAKVSKADGTVTADEVAVAERMLANMRLMPAERAMCVGYFILSQREGWDLKTESAALVSEMNLVACQFLHGLLWKVAQADGCVTEAERSVLDEIGEALGIGKGAGSHPLSAFNRKALESAGVPPSLLRLAD